MELLFLFTFLFTFMIILLLFMLICSNIHNYYINSYNTHNHIDILESKSNLVNNQENKCNTLYISYKLDETNTSECPICLEPMRNDNIYQLNCLHKYHKKCINNWWSSKIGTNKKWCPICGKINAYTIQIK